MRLMYNDLQDKVEYEYCKFRQLLLATSRENIYEKADEIIFKQEIRDYIRANESLYTIEEKDKLMCIENLIEHIYLICREEDYGISDIPKAMESLM